jgi:hypothetical protein
MLSTGPNYPYRWGQRIFKRFEVQYPRATRILHERRDPPRSRAIWWLCCNQELWEKYKKTVKAMERRLIHEEILERERREKQQLLFKDEVEAEEDLFIKRQFDLQE